MRVASFEQINHEIRIPKNDQNLGRTGEPLREIKVQE